MWEGARSEAIVRQVGNEWIQRLSRNFDVHWSKEMEQQLKRSADFKKGDTTEHLYDDGNESVESAKLMVKERVGTISVRGC